MNAQNYENALALMKMHQANVDNILITLAGNYTLSLSTANELLEVCAKEVELQQAFFSIAQLEFKNNLTPNQQ